MPAKITAHHVSSIDRRFASALVHLALCGCSDLTRRDSAELGPCRGLALEAPWRAKVWPRRAQARQRVKD